MLGDRRHGVRREAAIKIDNDLRGREYLEYKVSRTVEPGDLAYKIYPAVRRKLDFPDLPKLPPDERKASFDVVEKVFPTTARFWKPIAACSAATIMWIPKSA